MKRVLERITPGALLLRAFACLTAAAGIWLAMPGQFASIRVVLPVVLFAALTAVFPDGRVVGLTMLATAGLWMLSTLGFGEEASVVRTFGVACALYLTHSAAALAAVLPYDAIVDSVVLWRWAARSALVLLGAGAVTAAVVLLAPVITSTGSGFALGWGLAVVIAVVIILSRSARVGRRM